MNPKPYQILISANRRYLVEQQHQELRTQGVNESERGVAQMRTGGTNHRQGVVTDRAMHNLVGSHS
jgi:hypothetical protein